MTEAKKPAITEIPESAFTGELAHIRETLLTCIQCGSCSSSCPAVNNMDITPRTLWQLIRWGLRDEVLSKRTFWICTQCYACTVRCPRGIITSENMRLLRKWAAEENLLPELVSKMKETVNTHHNISGEDNARRLIWSENRSASIAR